MLKNTKILVGVTGSIAAYKACDLVQRLKEKGASVRAMMTPSATRILHPNALAALTGQPVITDAWEGASQGAMPHIDLARWADLLVVAPCTAHTLAELSLGLTGSIVSMTALAGRAPLVVAPAMNTVMLESAAVREHIGRLTARGATVLPTLNGNLACGELGDGKLLTPDEIVAYLDLVLVFGGQRPDLSGRKVLVAGGHTEEPLDGVRFLSNRSSGKTAVTLARAFALAGANVRLVLGKAEESAPNGVSVTRVATSAEFRETLLAAQADSDTVVMAAAIADFLPADAGAGKWKSSREMKSLDLQPAPNILQELGQRKSSHPNQILVGFALETESALEHGREKMKARNCDVMVVNTPLSRTGTGFGEDTVEVAVVDGHHPDAAKLSLVSKTELAADVVRCVAAKLAKRDAA